MISTAYVFNVYLNNVLLESYVNEDLARTRYHEELGQVCYTMTLLPDIVDGAILSHEARELGYVFKLLVEQA